MYNHGDIEAGKVVNIIFNTFDSTGASVTVTDLAAGDVKIHKDGGLTQRNSSAGVTVSIDFDGIIGCHLISIDTSDNTDAGFYAEGSDFQVRLEGITVATKTLNPFIATFSIRNRSALMPTTAGRKLDVESTGEAGLNFDNIKDASAAKTLTNITIPTTTAVTNTVAITSNSDITNILADTNEIQGKLPTNKIMGSSDVDNHDTDIDSILTDTNELQLELADGGRTDLLIDGIKTKTDGLNFTGTDIKATLDSEKVTVITNEDKTGYSISGMKQTLDALNDVSSSTIAALLTDLPTNTELATALSGLNDITVAEIIAGISDGTHDLIKIVKILVAACGGKSSGGETNTPVFRNPDDTKNRITATVDEHGNRLTMEYDFT
jgi:hypothetical protein